MLVAGLAARKVSVSLPQRIAETTSDSEIINLLLDRAMSKAEYFRSKSCLYQSAHGVSLDEFKIRSEVSPESFSAWDDLLVWEGYELAYREWQGRYEELLKCLK